MNIRTVDLNLLVCLDALLAERNVTRAANRVGLSQPAMSNALARLRALFRDPLLIRSGRAMVLSTKGQHLLQSVRAAMDDIRRVLDDEPRFAPASCNHAFSLGTTDYWEFLFLPRLMRIMEGEAPAARVEVKRLVGGQYEPPFDELRSGAFDIAIGFFPQIPATSPDIYQHRLCADRLVAIARATNRRGGGKISLGTYLQLGHVATKYRQAGGTFTVDSVLEGMGRNRVARVVVPHHFTVPYVVAQTGLVGHLPEKMARALCATLPVRIFDPPIKLRPINTVMLWHARTQSEPAHSWFRSLLVRCSGEP